MHIEKELMTLCEGKCKDGKQCSYQSSETVDGKQFCKIHEPHGECSICLDAMSKRSSSRLKCEHRLHTNCIQKWIRKGSTTCPLCRCELSTEEILRFYPDKDKNKKIHNVSIHQIDAEQLLQLFGMDLDADYLHQLSSSLRPRSIPDAETTEGQGTTSNQQSMLTITIFTV